VDYNGKLSISRLIYSKATQILCCGLQWNAKDIQIDLVESNRGEYINGEIREATKSNLYPKGGLNSKF
jgi:hypothetical protein